MVKVHLHTFFGSVKCNYVDPDPELKAAISTVVKPVIDFLDITIIETIMVNRQHRSQDHHG